MSWFSNRDDLVRLDRLSRRFGPILLAIARPLPILAEASVVLLGTTDLSWQRFVTRIALSNPGIAVAYAAVGFIGTAIFGRGGFRWSFPCWPPCRPGGSCPSKQAGYADRNAARTTNRRLGSRIAVRTILQSKLGETTLLLQQCQPRWYRSSTDCSPILPTVSKPDDLFKDLSSKPGCHWSEIPNMGGADGEERHLWPPQRGAVDSRVAPRATSAQPGSPLRLSPSEAIDHAIEGRLEGRPVCLGARANDLDSLVVGQDGHTIACGHWRDASGTL